MPFDKRPTCNCSNNSNLEKKDQNLKKKKFEKRNKIWKSLKKKQTGKPFLEVEDIANAIEFEFEWRFDAKIKKMTAKNIFCKSITTENFSPSNKKFRPKTASGLSLPH